MAKAGQITIDINAGTAKFIQDLEQVKGGIRSVGNQASSTFNARYAMFGLKDIAEGRYRFAAAELVNELTRLKGAMLGVGLAGVGIGILAFAFLELGNKIKEARDAATQAFNSLLGPIHKTSDELDVTNARLENSIAKLEHRPENVLAQNLAESRVEADKLSEALEKNFAELEKVMKDRQVTLWQRIVTFSAPTTDISEAATNLRSDIRGIDVEGRAAVGAATSQSDKDKAFAAWDKKKKDKIDWYTEWQGKQTNLLAVPKASGQDIGQRQEALETFGDDIGTERGAIDKQAAERRLSLTKEQLEAAKKASEDAKRAAMDWLHSKEQTLDKQKLANDMSVAQETSYWNEILQSNDAAARAALRNAEVVDAIDRKLLANKQKIREELKQANAEQFREWEDGIKAAQETQAHPAAFKLQTLKDADPDFSNEKIQHLIPEAQKEADREATEELKRSLKEQDEAWELSSEHTAQEVKKRAQASVDYLEWVRPFYVGVDALIDDEIKKVIESTKKIYEEADKLAKIQIESKEQTDIGANTAKKLAIEQQYAQYRVHSVQEELANAKALGQLEAADLQIKLVAAEIAHEEAMDEGNAVKIAQTRLEIDKARLGIQNQQLQLAVQITTIESEHNKTLKQGLDAFIHDANAQMKEPGDILKDGLTSALDQTSENLTKEMTGQKAKWADEFKSIGRSMLKESIQSELTKGLGSLGIKIGKQDGSKEKPYYTLDANGIPLKNVASFPPSLGGSSSGGSGGSSGPGIFGGSGSNPFIFHMKDMFPSKSGGDGNSVSDTASTGLTSLAAAWRGMFPSKGMGDSNPFADQLASDFPGDGSDFPKLAGGGDVDPGSSYWVGDGGDGSGKEMFTPKTAGTVTPASKMGGGGDTYHIDNRGAELGSENRLHAVLQSVHASAVSSAVRATKEQSRRTPRNRHF